MMFLFVVATLALSSDPPPTDTPASAPAPRPSAPPPSAPPPSAPPPSAPPPSALAGYQRGFFIRSPDGDDKLVIRGLVQPRFALVAADPDVKTWKASFLVQRAQITLSGSILDRDLGFKLHTEFGQGNVFIRDAYLQERFNDLVTVRAGQWKLPFSRQFMTPAWKLAFFDRAITDAAFASGRDIGVAVQDGYQKSPPFEWAAGVFSGATDKPRITGDVVTDPDKGDHLENVKVSNFQKLFTPTFAGRVGFNLGKVKGYDEIDDDGGPFRLGIGVSAVEAVDIAGNGAGATDIDVDAIAKAEHFDVSGALYASAAQADPAKAGQDFAAFGGHVQAGVLLMDRVHVGVRYAGLFQQDGTTGQEVLVNALVLLFGRQVEWGVEAGTVLVDNVPDVRVRTQAQLKL